MAERVLPQGMEGYVDKILSFDQYLGDLGRTATLSRKISESRAIYGFSGDMDSDWEEASKVFKNEVIEEVIRRQSPSLRVEGTSAIIPTYNMIVVMIDTSHDN